jgi:hypothetical protein
VANNSLLASDNFASGSLAPGWAAITGLSTCHVVADSPKDTQSNVLSTEAGQIYTGNAFPNNQISEAVATEENQIVTFLHTLTDGFTTPYPDSNTFTGSCP